jgi:hypothetical protein
VLTEQQQKTQSYPIALQNFGMGTLADLFGDLVIYRSLEPLDRRLRGFKTAYYQMGLDESPIPRKLNPNYARAALWFLEQVQKLRGAALNEVLFIGDTLSGDAQAFRNILKISDLPGSAFIATEKAAEPEHHEIMEGNVYFANRWASIADWLAWTLEQGFQIDEGTVVIVDMDKTAIGARGRNDKAIDIARLEGIYRTIDSILGDKFDHELFEKHYNDLNRAKYHPLTEDNQDYLAYICLVLNTGLIRCDELMEKMDKGNINSFEQFIRWVEALMLSGTNKNEALRQVHEAVMASIRVGDPTPFKRFRREEFTSTLRHMGNLPDDVPAEERLSEEITITQEVKESAEWLLGRGCTVLSMSDKPDEASVPHPSFHKGLTPIHKAPTHCVGVSIAEKLRNLG